MWSLLESPNSFFLSELYTKRCRISRAFRIWINWFSIAWPHKVIAKILVQEWRPPTLARYRSPTKNHLHNCWHRLFCRELFSAHFQTIPDARRWTETEKTSKYYQNVKKAIFLHFNGLPSKIWRLWDSTGPRSTSEKRNILGLLVSWCDLLFQIRKSQKKNWSPADFLVIWRTLS